MKKLFIIAALSMIAADVCAQHISEQEALDRALEYISSNSKTWASRSSAPIRGGSVKLESATVDAKSIYAFNLKDGGFIIASADSRTLPVLGYSDNGYIDWDNLPENIRSWFKQYDQAIATIGDRTDYKDGNLINDNNPKRTGTRTDRTPIEPFIKTHWNQFEPYYDLTPLYAGTDSTLNGKQCLTGCPATAIAQVLNYYRWPESMPDGLAGYNSMDWIGMDEMWYVDSLPPVTFDYDNMLNDYHVLNPETGKKELVGTDTERKAVATLMRYCGQATSMIYGTSEIGGSGSFGDDMRDALANHLGYPATTTLYRSSFSNIDEWENIVYDELASGRPVIYNGTSEAAGHAFICDGYDDTGLFHINWGWGGECDGYFSLSLLNPDHSSNVTYGSSDIGFSMNQQIFIYLSPDLKEQPEPKGTNIVFFQQDNIQVTEVNAVSFYYLFDGEDNTAVDNALGSIDDSGQLTPLYYAKSYDTIAYPHNLGENNMVVVLIDSTDFQPGDSVTLYPMLRLREPGAEWKVIPPTLSNVVTGRSESGQFFIHPSGKPLGFKLIDGAMTYGTGRLDEPNDITVSISNQTPKDLTYKLQFMALYYGDMKEADVTDNTPYLSADTCMNKAYIRSWQDGEVTFSLTPKHKGLTRIKVYTEYDIFIGDFYLELANDTLINYSRYIENRSSYTIEDGKCSYDIVLCDTTSNGVPVYVTPSDSIIYRIRCLYNDSEVMNIIVKDEIREYLKALSANGENRDSIFTYKADIDISKPGFYHLQSYLCDYVNGEYQSISCNHSCHFRISESTNVKSAQTDAEPVIYYDILGRPISGIPTQSGIYITNDHKKIIISDK